MSLSTLQLQREEDSCLLSEFQGPVLPVATRSFLHVVEVGSATCLAQMKLGSEGWAL